MFYLVTKKELELVSEGKISPDNLTDFDRMALITWSGEDIVEMLRDELSESWGDDALLLAKILKVDTNLKDFIKQVIDALENCEIGNCIDEAFYHVLEKKRKEE